VALIVAILMFGQCAGAAELITTCHDFRRARTDRHVYVIYDGSLSYRHVRDWPRTVDLQANLDRVRRIGSDVGHYFSLLLTRGYLRYDCAGYLRDDPQPHRLEILGGQIAWRGSDAHRAWMSFLAGKTDDIERRLAKAEMNRPKPEPLVTYTDLEGALHRATYAFKRHPAREKYLVIFSDLDHDPQPQKHQLPFCEELDLKDVIIVVANFGTEPPPGIKFKRSLAERETWLETRAREGGARAVCYDWRGTLLSQLGLE